MWPILSSVLVTPAEKENAKCEKNINLFKKDLIVGAGVDIRGIS